MPDVVPARLEHAGDGRDRIPAHAAPDQVVRQPKVVFCTTENDAAHIRAAIDAGAAEYVRLPSTARRWRASCRSSGSRDRRGCGAAPRGYRPAAECRPTIKLMIVDDPPSLDPSCPPCFPLMRTSKWWLWRAMPRGTGRAEERPGRYSPARRRDAGPAGSKLCRKYCAGVRVRGSSWFRRFAKRRGSRGGALALGAADTLPKPGTGAFGGRFSEILADRIRKMAGWNLARRPAPGNPLHRPRCTFGRCRDAARLLGLGASTGGLHALSEFLRALPASIQAPIPGHPALPPVFMPYFARQIEAASGRLARVAEDGMAVRQKKYCSRPATDPDRRRHGSSVREALPRASQTGYMPSVDSMVTAMADAFLHGGVAVIFSGWARDGLSGARGWSNAAAACSPSDQRSSAVGACPARSPRRPCVGSASARRARPRVALRIRERPRGTERRLLPHSSPGCSKRGPARN